MSHQNLELILIRHGNTFESDQTAVQVGKKTDLPLTREGRHQAERIAQFLSTNQILPNTIHCGTLSRQTETANIIHQSFPDAQLHSNQEAFDEIDYGAWEGLSSEEIKNKWPLEYQNWLDRAQWPNNIFSQTLEERIHLLQSWKTKILSTQNTKTTHLVVSSNGILRLMLYFNPSLWEKVTQQNQMDLYKVKTGHLCKVTYSNNQLQINLEDWNIKPET